MQPPAHSQAPTPHTVMPISPDGRRRESTHKESIWVIQLKSEGHSFCEMQQKTGVGKTTIHCIVNDGTQSSMYGIIHIRTRHVSFSILIGRNSVAGWLIVASTYHLNSDPK